MKKMVALALAIAMLVSLASVASAMTFTIGVSCTSTTSYTNAPGTRRSPKAVQMEEFMSTVMIM